MVIQWIIIGLLVLIGFWYIKLEHQTQKIKIIVLVVIAVLIYFSMIEVFSSEKVDLTSPRGVIGGVYAYFGWMGQAVTGLWDVGVNTVHMVGNAIKIDDSKKEESSKKRLINRKE